MNTDHSTDPAEIWKPAPLPGYTELYEVSNFGRVRRSAPGYGTFVGRILHGSFDRGYIRMTLNRPIPGGHAERRELIHRLVALAFIGPSPDGCDVHHKDRNSLNNHADNLEYLTIQQHYFLHGPPHTREDKLKVKLLAEQWRAARQETQVNPHPKRITQVSQFPDLPKEVWKSVPIPEYSQLYEVSNLGRVRRSASGPRTRKGNLKRLSTARSYLQVGLSRPLRYGGHKIKHYFVHLLIAEAFHGPRPPGHVCNHKDGNKLNSHADNLEWVTPSEDRRHAIKLGLYRCIGEENPSAKITEEEARKILQALQQGVKGCILAKRYQITGAMVSRIKLRKAWKHL